MIRKIRPEDRELYIKLTGEFYSSDAVLHSIPEEFRAAAFEELISSDKYLEGYIIEFEHEAAGYALLCKTFSQEAGGMVLWLDEIYIRDRYRGRGLGKEFFKYLFENCPASRYRLEAEPDNSGAIRLYRSLGFKDFPYIQLIKENKS